MIPGLIPAVCRWTVVSAERHPAWRAPMHKYTYYTWACPWTTVSSNLIGILYYFAFWEATMLNEYQQQNCFALKVLFNYA